MRSIISTAAVSEPITLTEAKDFLRIDADLTADDDFIEDILIPSVRSYFEKSLDKSLASQEITTLFDCIEQNLELPYGPVTTFDALYRFTNGSWEEITTGFRVVNEVPAVIYFSLIPTADDGPAKLKAVYTAGETLSPMLKIGFLLLMKEWYENRINLGGTVSSEVSKLIETLTTKEGLCRLT